MKLKDIKLEYVREELNTEDLKANPYDQLHDWMNDVIQAEITYPNAATLSTVSADHIPSSRTVLIKDYHELGITFFSDYTSAKAMDINSNKNVSLLFFWKELDRQIRINGQVSKIDPMKSENYWNSRPKESQISAMASNQSSIISKEELYEHVNQLNSEFKNKTIPCPPNWGGYLVSIDSAEFWQGRPNRLHDRFKYTKHKSSWQIQRLAP